MKKAEAVESAYLFGAILLLIARLGLQALLYRSGFEALTADEFGRTVLAACWARRPHAVWHGVWLPFHLYMVGVALRLKWELLWVPRAITMALGIASIAVMYQLSRKLFEDRQIGLISAILLAVNPVHTWLSSTPLTEIPHATLVLAFLLGFTLYLKSKKTVTLYFSAVSLAIANGFRFEAWAVSALFSLYVVGEGALRIWREGRYTRPVFPSMVAALIPWMFPITWITASYVETGDPFFSLASIRSYKTTWYGDARDFYAYLRTFFRADPYLTVLAPLALVISLLRYKDSRAVQWVVAMTVISFSIFVYFHRGQVEPPGNYIRYLALFIFIIYPAFACLLKSAVERITGSQPARTVLLATVVLAIIATQVHTTFQFVNDPAADGLKVGETIRLLRMEHPELSQRPVLIELSYWQYLAIHVGANDISLLVYDRELDFERRQTTSLLLSDLDVVRRCLALYDISYIVVRSPELKGVVEQNLGILPSEEVNHYYFYQVPNALREAQVYEGSCPLGHDPFGAQP